MSMVEDTTSQNEYGVRAKEVVDDDSLFSDEACQLKAESLLEYLKDPSVSLRCIVKGGDYRFRPGWNHPIKLPVLGINDYTYFKVIDYSHFVDENKKWTINVKFSREPIYIDKIFRKLYQIAK